MAQGTVLTFEEFGKALGDKDHDMGNDSWYVTLHSVIPTISDSSPAYGDWTECAAGGNYTQGNDVSNAVGVTWIEVDGVTTFDVTTNISWAAGAGGPVDIRAAVLWNDTSVGDLACLFVDMTADGSTPLSMVSGPISIAWDDAGAFTLTRAA
jgi:hypothetical protein